MSNEIEINDRKYTKKKNGIYERFLKRPLDFLLALILVIVLFPILIIVGVLVKFKLGGPVIFKQKRPGLNEKIFTLYKFRTMTNKKDSNGELLSDKLRLTKFGKFLRSTSLDELPELFNILIGQMSFIGPRPLLVSYLPLYNDSQKQRHSVRPGLSGLAQINGRNTINWEDRFELDIKYVESITFCKDVSILLFTVIKVFFRESINQEGEATKEPYKGNKVE